MIKVDSRRINKLNKNESIEKGEILYWMSRDQRAHDNWALLFAQEISQNVEGFVSVVFCLNPEFLGATLRQYSFMIEGLKETAEDLNSHNISFKIIFGKPEEELPKYIKKNNIKALVTDFSPLKISRVWKEKINHKIEIPFFEVDAHNIVPCLYVSNKMEYGAYTIRPKIHKLLNEFLTEYPALKKQEKITHHEKIEWEDVFKKIRVDTDVLPVNWIQSGPKAAKRTLREFLDKKIEYYSDKRNIPTENYVSNLSPYIHFGQISAQTIVLETYEKVRNSKKDSFVEELVVRRELADNYCYFNKEYDNPLGYPSWAIESHKAHSKDKREFIYTLSKLEKGETHDELWNAAQKEMLKTGKMHGYLRMYWAKKILEWTPDIETAHKYCIYLNDKYELDGRDPNGYTGIAWSLGGVHDRPWFTKPVFGKIRYMSFNGAKTKFNIDEYINKINSINL